MMTTGATRAPRHQQIRRTGEIVSPTPRVTSNMGWTVQSRSLSSTKVFVVHGHAPGLRAEVARLIERLGPEPAILSEQPNAGATLIEKLLANADVSFAIVLATADDVGSRKQRGSATQYRPRQDVVFELGFFVGRLGRDRVALLVESGLEVFSDFHGVVHHELDECGA